MLLHSLLRKRSPASVPRGTPCPWPCVSRVRTLTSRGQDSQPGRAQGRERRVRGQRVKAPGPWARAAEEEGPAWAGQQCPEQSGGFLRARLGLGPGGLPLGVACPRGGGPGGCRGARYSLLDGAELAVMPTSG